jgi:hypothetical protein
MLKGILNERAEAEEEERKSREERSHKRRTAMTTGLKHSQK